MREVISVHVGQAGVQIGNACCKFLFFCFDPYTFVVIIMAWKMDGKRVVPAVVDVFFKMA